MEGFRNYAERLFLGENVFINRNVMICATFRQSSTVKIEDNVFIGPNVTICCVSHQIGDSIQRAGKVYNEDVIIGKGCWIGANVVILPGVRIGAGTIVGAGSVVIKSLESNALYVGNPCYKVRNLNISCTTDKQ